MIGFHQQQSKPQLINCAKCQQVCEHLLVRVKAGAEHWPLSLKILKSQMRIWLYILWHFPNFLEITLVWSVACHGGSTFRFWYSPMWHDSLTILFLAWKVVAKISSCLVSGIRPRILGEALREVETEWKGGREGRMDGWRLAGAVSLISLLSLLIHPRHADSSLPSRTPPACQVIHIPYLHSHHHLHLHHHSRQKETDTQGGTRGTIRKQ